MDSPLLLNLIDDRTPEALAMRQQRDRAIELLLKGLALYDRARGTQYFKIVASKLGFFRAEYGLTPQAVRQALGMSRVAYDKEFIAAIKMLRENPGIINDLKDVA